MGDLTKFAKILPVFASCGGPLIYCGSSSTGVSKGIWKIKVNNLNPEGMGVRGQQVGGGGQIVTTDFKVALGLVGKKKSKNNGLKRIAVVDYHKRSGSGSLWRKGIKGAIQIAEQIDDKGDAFRDISDDIAWKLLGVETEKSVGYMLVGRLNNEGKGVLQQNVQKGRGGVQKRAGNLDLNHLVKRSEDKKVCKDRAFNLKVSLETDFTVEWGGTNQKLGVISPKVIGGHQDAKGARDKMRKGCEDGGYFVASNAYFWLKDGDTSGVSEMFEKENDDAQRKGAKILHIKDQIKNVIYDNIEEIELTGEGMRDSFGNELKWGTKSKPIITLELVE